MGFVVLGLVSPGLGLVFWKTIAFLIVMVILGKFAWPPIIKALSQREKAIEEALKSAQEARNEMKELEAKNEKLMLKAKEERDAVLAEARKMKDKLVDEAKHSAKKEGERIMEEAKKQIHYERMAAVTDLKNEIASLSIDIAEKILQKELEDENKHHNLIQDQLKKVKFN